VDDVVCASVDEIWYAKITQPGATSVYVTSDQSAKMAVWVLELSGLDPTNPLDVGAMVDNYQPDSGVIRSPQVVPSAANAVVVSVAAVCGTITGLNAGSPFTALDVRNGCNTAYLLTPGHGTFGAVWDYNPGAYNSWNASTVAFK
jgi:hypothetical protein